MIKNWYDKRTMPESTTELLQKKLDSDSVRVFSDRASKAHYDKISSPKKQQEPHEGFQNLISSQEIHKPQIGDDNYEPKMIFRHGKEDFMVKPYHSFNTVGGLATNVMRRLFKDAGMEKNVEDVRLHHIDVDEHKVPVMVHKFEKDVDHFNPTKPYSKLDGAKITLLDYLHGNPDRHHKNIMMRNAPNEKGEHDLIAIDHSSGLDYSRPDSGFAANTLEHNFDKADPKDIALWWNNHKEDMHKGFMDEMAAVQDQKLKDRFIGNFQSRHKNISRWADNVLKGKAEEFEPYDTSYKNEKHPLSMHGIPSTKERMDFLAEKISQNNKLSPYDISYGLSMIAPYQYEEVPESDFMDFMNKLPHNDNGYVAKHEALDNLMKSPRNKDKAKALLQYEESLPVDSRHLNPIMRDRVKRYVGSEE